MAKYKPPKSKPVNTTSTGTRGCPYPLGALSVIGADIEDNLIWQRTGLDTPTLVYELKSDKVETFLIVITDPQGALIFKKTMQVSPAQKTILIRIDTPIQEGINYQVTAGLLCEEDPEAATIINSLLVRGRFLTFLDEISQNY